MQLNAYSSAPIRTLLVNFASLVFLLMPGVAKSQLGAFDPAFKPIESNLREWATNRRVFDTADYAYDLSSQTGYFTRTQALQDVPNYTTMLQGLTGYLG